MSTVSNTCDFTVSEPELLDRRHAAEFVGLSEESMRSADIAYVNVDGVSWWRRDDLEEYLRRPRVRARRANPRPGDVGPGCTDRQHLDEPELLDTRQAARYLIIGVNSMKSTGIAPAEVTNGCALWRRCDLDAYLTRPAVVARRERNARAEPKPLPHHRFPLRAAHRPAAP